jgi:hypothetical protein
MNGELSRWVKVGETGPLGEYIHHAGLSPNGAYCFLAEHSDNIYMVWDIENAEPIWSHNRYSDRHTYPDLAKCIQDGFVEIRGGPAKGRYRIFGLYEQHPLTVSETLGLRLVQEWIDDDWGELEFATGELIIQQLSTREELQRLVYDDDFPDWAFASFSDNDATIGVLTPHNLTFFARLPLEADR